MWFIDDSFKKNRNYYIKEASKENTYNIETSVIYGGALFLKLFNRIDVWEEICSYLLKNKLNRNNDTLNIPDFDTSDEILKALKTLKACNPKLYGKLISDIPEYIQLRRELFPTGKNLKLV